MADNCTLSPLGWRSLWEIVASQADWTDGLADRLRAGAGQCRVIDLSPERKLVVSARESSCASVDEAAARIVDVSDNWRLLTISGESARDLLARGMEIDVSRAALPVGATCQALCAGAPVILHVVDEQSIDLLIATSYAPWLAKWLATALSILSDEVTHAAA